MHQKTNGTRLKKQWHLKVLNDQFVICYIIMYPMTKQKGLGHVYVTTHAETRF
jgi:hypothetical protein